MSKWLDYVAKQVQIHDALAYYYDNQEEINSDFRENSEDAVRPQIVPPPQ